MNANDKKEMTGRAMYDMCGGNMGIQCCSNDACCSYHL